MSRFRRNRALHKADTKAAPQTEAVFTPEQAVAIAQALATKAPVNGGQTAALPRNPGLYQIPFSPGIPLVPSAINSPRPDSGRPEPRAYEYPITANLPGSNEKLVPWSVLRQAADGVSIFRKCIEIRKNEFSSLEWDIVVSKKAVMRELRASGGATPRAELEQQMQAKLAPEIARLSAWWEEPDRRNGLSWIEWIKKALEDRFVLDALAIYPRHTFGGDLYSLEILDGSTVKPLLDELGGRPMPPSPAYQQLLWGFPRGEFIADLGEDGLPTGCYPSDQLIYEVDNVRSWTPYGYGAVERALTDGALYVQRNAWQMATYTDGVMPSGWLLAGEGQADWTSDQLREYEQLLNDYYSGITGNRQRLRILPYGMTPHETANEAEKYKPDYDLYLLKLNAGHFETTIAELGFTEQGGLGSTGWHEGQADVQDRKATRPTVAYVQALINKLSRRHLRMPLELEIKFEGQEFEDQSAEDEIADRQVKSGRLTINEDRDRRGLARFSFPEADMPFVLGGTGAVTFLDGAKEAADAAQEQAAAIAQAKTNPPAPGDNVGGEGGGQPGGHDDGPNKPKPGDGQGKPLDKAEDADLDKVETAELVKGELAAYERWSRRNPNPKRPFRAQYATPDDFADPDPTRVAFDGWVFVTDAGEILKGDFMSWNSANPKHPRGPNGKFVKVGSELHDLALRIAREHEHHGGGKAGHDNIETWHPPTPGGVRAAYADALAAQGREVGGDAPYVSVADLRDRLGGTRAEQDAALREIEQHGDTNIVPQAAGHTLTDRTRGGAVRIGGQDKTHVAIGPNIGEPGPVDVEARRAAAEEAKAAADERSAAAKAKAAADREALHLTPKMQQQIRDDAAEIRAERPGITDAEVRAELEKDYAPGAVAKALANPATAALDHGAVRDALAKAGSREEAAAYIDGLKLKAPELRQLAKDLGVTVKSSDSKAAVRDTIVGLKVGRRLDSQAILSTPRAHDVMDKPRSAQEERVTTAVQDEKALESVPVGLEASGKLRGAVPAGWTKSRRTAAEDALVEYQGGSYATINNTLRSGKSDDFVQEWVDGLDDAMSISKLQQDTVVYRGILKPEKVFGDAWTDSDSKVGLTWVDNGFTSTTADQRVVGRADFTGGEAKEAARLRIVVPAGTPAVRLSDMAPPDAKLDPSDLSDAAHSVEAEILLNRGLKFRVVADHGYDASHTRILDVEVVPA